MKCRCAGACLQDIEADCNRLLETGLFARVRPKTQLPMGTQAPSYLRDRDGHLNPVIPLNQVRASAAHTLQHEGPSQVSVSGSTVSVD
jgi:hypothetical protein